MRTTTTTTQRWFSQKNPNDGTDDPKLRKEKDEKTAAALSNHLIQLGVADTSLHESILQTVASAFPNNVTAATLDSLGKSGIQALADACRRELQQSDGGNKNSGPSSCQILIQVPHHRSEFTVVWKRSDTLLQAAQNDPVLSEYIEASCGGTMACSTCHVYLDPRTFRRAGSVSEPELDMLDLAHQPKENESRLACQVVLTKEMMEQKEEIVVTIPDGVNDMWN